MTQLSPGRTIILPSSVCMSSLPYCGKISMFPSLLQKAWLTIEAFAAYTIHKSVPKLSKSQQFKVKDR
jgi:hypothetical protein